MNPRVLADKNTTHGKATIFLVSDEAESARIWAYSLEQAGMQVCQAGFSDKTLQIWANEFPDLIILDGHGSKVELAAFCRQLRAEAAVPILVLTATGEESYLLATYQAGADDCIPPPVSPRLFLTKVRAWLRRAQVFPSAALDAVLAGGFRLDPDRRMLQTPPGDVVRLTNLETRLLYLLMSHPSWIMETEYLVDRVWGHFGEGDSILLKNLVYRLRRKIEPDPSQPRYLLTESSLGYRFQLEEDAVPPPKGPPGDPPPGRRLAESIPPAKSAARSSTRGTGQHHPGWPRIED